MNPRRLEAETSIDGSRVSIRFRDGDGDGDGVGSAVVASCCYSASWLVSNDPRRVVLPSGQRSPSPGREGGGGGRVAAPARIVGASIELLEVAGVADGGGGAGDRDDDDDPSATTTRRRVPGPTLGDCCHPLAVYGDNPAWMSATTASAADDESSSSSTTTTDEDSRGGGRGGGAVRPYLVVEWAAPAAAPPPAMTAATPSGDGSGDRTDDAWTRTSIYDVGWLMRFRNDGPSRARRRRRAEVRPVHAVMMDRSSMRRGASSSVEEEEEEEDEKELEECGTRGDDGLARVDYRSIVGEDGAGTPPPDGVFALLHSVFRDGAAVVSGVPAPPSPSPLSFGDISEDDYPVARVAKAATSGGRLSHGALYGSVFHVRAGEGGGINAAYTSDGLRMHQDLAYYESPPGLQFLHCVANGSGVVGGESTMIDGLAAAYRLRELRPGSFETLVRCPATFVKQRDGACMTYRRPHIVLADEEGWEEGEEGMGGKGSPHYGYIDRQIVAVHWSPPFEGPVLLPPWRVDRYHEAYADFERMLNGVDDGDDGGGGDPCSPDDDLSRYAGDFTWERRLQPGEMLVLNNRRMLHGRRKFSAAEGASVEDGRRHLVGCYTNIDDTLNLYRVLLRERGRASTSILNVGNGTAIIPS